MWHLLARLAGHHAREVGHFRRLNAVAHADCLPLRVHLRPLLLLMMVRIVKLVVLLLAVLDLVANKLRWDALLIQVLLVL